MRVTPFLIICFLLFAPAFSHGEIVYLKDGSTIQGKLVKLLNDTLHFETSFGAPIRIHRSKVLRVEFAGPASSQSVILTPGIQQQQPAGIGTLQVHFDKFELTSRITVHRGKNRDDLEKANSIEKSLFLGRDKVASVIDSVTDKVIREGPETILRNSITPRTIKVAVNSGTYRCRVHIGNTMAGDFHDRFVGDPLDKEVVAHNVVIRAGETTALRIGFKRKMKIGSGYMYVIE